MSGRIVLTRRHANREFALAAVIAALLTMAFGLWTALDLVGTRLTEAIDDLGRRSPRSETPAYFHKSQAGRACRFSI
jgi:hypothetical protein